MKTSSEDYFLGLSFFDKVKLLILNLLSRPISFYKSKFSCLIVAVGKVDLEVNLYNFLQFSKIYQSSVSIGLDGLE